MGHYVQQDTSEAGGALLICTDGRLVNGRDRLSRTVGQRRQFGPLPHVVVDLSEAALTFDSASLGDLVRTTAVVKATGGRVFLVCPDARLRRLFTLSHLAPLFTFFNTVSDAMAATL